MAKSLIDLGGLREAGYSIDSIAKMLQRNLDIDGDGNPNSDYE